MIRGRTLIKRFPVPMCRRKLVTSVVDANNPFANNTESYEFTRLAAEECTLQSLKDADLKALPEGSSNTQAFTIFSNTGLFKATDNTNLLSDVIFIPDSYSELNGYIPSGSGGWFTVERSYIRNTGVINHCEALIVKAQSLENTDGLPQFPDTSLLEPQISTKAALKDGAWEASWVGENI